MDDFERHVIIHLVMRSVGLVCMMLLPLYLAMSLLLLSVFDMNSVIWRESCTPPLPVRATEMSNILPFVKYSSDPFFEFCRPHKSGASKDVTWVVRRRLTVLRCVEGEDQLINTHMVSMCSFVGCVPKCLD